MRHYGEPFADHAALPSFYLARFAREHVTVALNGRRRRRELRRLPALHDQPAAGKARPAAPAGARRGRLAGARARRGGDPRERRDSGWGGSLVASALDRESRYLAQRSVFTADRSVHSCTRPSTARCSARRAPRSCVLDPWRALERHRAARSAARRRRRRLPPRRPADEDRHRHDGLLARGPLAAARPRADGARRRRCRRELKAHAPGAQADPALGAAGLGSRRDPRRRPSGASSCRWREWFRGELRDYAREVLLDPASPLRGLVPGAGGQAAARRARRRHTRSRPRHLDAADARALVRAARLGRPSGLQPASAGRGLRPAGPAQAASALGRAPRLRASASS